MIDLTPIGEPPSRCARWCPQCCCWWTHVRRRRCPACRAAVVRQRPLRIPRPGELRPGIVAQWSEEGRAPVTAQHADEPPPNDHTILDDDLSDDDPSTDDEDDGEDGDDDPEVEDTIAA